MALLVNSLWSERSACAAIMHHRQNILVTNNGIPPPPSPVFALLPKGVGLRFCNSMFFLSLYKLVKLRLIKFLTNLSVVQVGEASLNNHILLQTPTTPMGFPLPEGGMYVNLCENRKISMHDGPGVLFL